MSMRNSREERGQGIPLTDEERAARHETMFPGTPLPARGTGLTQNIGALSMETCAPYIIAGIFTLVSSLIIANAMKKR